MAVCRHYMMIFIIFCVILASVKVIFCNIMTAQLTDNDEVLNICIDNKVHAFHLDFLLDIIPFCYYRTEIYLSGGSAVEIKIENNKCCIELMLLNTVRSSNNFTLVYKIIIGPVKENINIIMKDPQTKEVLDKVIFQRKYGSFKEIQLQERHLQLKMTLAKSCFTSVMTITLTEYMTEPCSFNLWKFDALNINLFNKNELCSVIKFDNGKFLTNNEMSLEFEMPNLISNDIIVELVFNKLIMGHFVVKGKHIEREESSTTPSNVIVTEETNYIPNKIVVSSSSSNNVDDSQTQIYLNLPLLDEIVGNMSKFSVVIANSKGIISKSGIIHQPDRFIDKTYEECQQQQQQNIWNDCIYEVNITDYLSRILSNAPLNNTGFVLGAKEKCTKQDKYSCNGPLRAGHIYNVSLRVYSHPSGRYKTTAPFMVKTDIAASIDPLIIWFVTGAVTVLILLTVLLLVIVRVKCHRYKHQNCNEERISDEGHYATVYPAISATNNDRQTLQDDDYDYSEIDESQEQHYAYIDPDAAAG